MSRPDRRIGIVLAAGAATRFGGGKLAALIRNEPLIAHAIRAARAAPVERVLVVASFTLAVGEWPGEPPVEVVRVTSGALSQSLAAGITAAQAAGAEAAYVFLADMPLIPLATSVSLADRLGDAYAAVPVCQGRPGHPVLFARRAFPDLLALSGDEGAGRLLRGRADVVRVPIDDPGILLDVDVPGDISRLSERTGDAGEGDGG